MSDLASFEKLEVWKISRLCAVEVYRLISRLPDNEKYGLSDQLRRSMISVPSNIAEGSGRVSPREKIHFINIAYGSLMEVRCQLLLCNDLGFFTAEETKAALDYTISIAKMLNRLSSSVRSRITNH